MPAGFDGFSGFISAEPAATTGQAILSSIPVATSSTNDCSRKTCSRQFFRQIAGLAEQQIKKWRRRDSAVDGVCGWGLGLGWRTGVIFEIHPRCQNWAVPAQDFSMRILVVSSTVFHAYCFIIPYLDKTLNINTGYK